MRVAVLIPWRATDCPHRTKALAVVIARHARNRWPVVIGRHDDGPWVKALAVADALTQTQAQILIIADADVWTDGLPEAVQAVQDGAAWAIPHRGVIRLTQAGTELYGGGGELLRLPVEENAYLGVEGGGIVVINRRIYEMCPLDQRFEGWGGEDESWGMALRTLHGPPHRVRMPLVHLWHPPQERATRSKGSEANTALRKRYARAMHNPTVMQEVLDDPCRFIESFPDDCASQRIG